MNFSSDFALSDKGRGLPGNAMSCDSIRADLVAYLQDELGEPRRVEVQNHLAGCRACAAELDGFRTARDAAKRLRVGAPSADFQKQVRERIARKVAELRAQGSVRFRTSRERVEAAQEWPGLAEWLRQRRRLGLMLLVSAAVLVPCAGLVWIYVIHPYQDEVARHKNEALAERNWLVANYSRKARHSAERLDLEARADGTVAGIALLADGPVKLVAGAGSDADDRCVLVYTAGQWQALSARRPELINPETQAAWQAMIAGAREATVDRGTLRLPPELFVRLLGEPGQVTVLRLGDHSEIWDRSDLDAYLRGPSASPRGPAKGRIVPLEEPAP